MRAAEPQFDEIYRDLILDHYRAPRNHGELAGATARLHGLNPVCGDEIFVDVRVEDERLAEIAFRGQGCSISLASASMMTEALRGKGSADVRRIAGKFEAMLRDGEPPDRELGDLEALEGVAKFPVRVKCALLAWKVVEDGLPGAENEDN